MQNNWRVNIAGFKTLFADDFKTLCRLDTFEDHCLVNALGYRNIAIGAFIRVQPIRVGFLPELLVVKRFKPFFNVVAVFKSLHIPIVPNPGFSLQQFSYKGYTV